MRYRSPLLLLLPLLGLVAGCPYFWEDEPPPPPPARPVTAVPVPNYLAQVGDRLISDETLADYLREEEITDARQGLVGLIEETLVLIASREEISDQLILFQMQRTADDFWRWAHRQLAAQDPVPARGTPEWSAAVRRLQERWGDKIRVATMIARNVPPVAVSPAEIAEYFNAHPEQFRRPARTGFRWIRLDFTGDEEAERARRQAERIVADLRGGRADFAALAARYSSIPGAEENCHFEADQGQLRPEIEAVLEIADPGLIQGPLRIDGAYHIFQVEWRRPAESVNLEQAQNPIERRLRQERWEAARQRYLRRLRGEIYVEIFSGEAAAATPEAEAP